MRIANCRIRCNSSLSKRPGFRPRGCNTSYQAPNGPPRPETFAKLARYATVTGRDFSSAALNVARRLSDETGLKADFVEGTVYHVIP